MGYMRILLVVDQQWSMAEARSRGIGDNPVTFRVALWFRAVIGTDDPSRAISFSLAFDMKNTDVVLR